MKLKKLYRSQKNRLLGGVIGGLSEYFNLNLKVARLLFCGLAIFPASMPFALFGYIVLWAIIPLKRTKGDSPMQDIFKQFYSSKQSEGRVVEAEEVESQK